MSKNRQLSKGIGDQESHNDPEGKEFIANLGNLHESPIGKGAIVESGSTPDGHYVRWENGEQVCWEWAIEITLSTSEVGVTADLTFPADFNTAAGTVSVQTEANMDLGLWGASEDRRTFFGSRDASNTQYQVLGLKEDTRSFADTYGVINFVAWGFWK